MTTSLVQPSAPTGAATIQQTVAVAPPVRAVSPVQSSPAASPRPGIPASGATDPRASERRLVTTAAGGQTARVAYIRTAESWRLVGRPFDPRERALSRGEQHAKMADRLVCGGSGVLAGVMALYVIASAVWR